MSKFFSLAYLTLPNTHPVDQIEIAAQCGYEGVACGPSPSTCPENRTTPWPTAECSRWSALPWSAPA